MYETDYKCPKCNSPVEYDSTCPTYTTSSGRFMCMPTCGNATEYFCSSDDCGWEYIDGLDSKNPSYVANEKNKPAFLVA